jgi:hypothetical protein
VKQNKEATAGRAGRDGVQRYTITLDKLVFQIWFVTFNRSRRVTTCYTATSVAR